MKKIFITNRNKDRALELIKNFADFALEKKCELEFLEMKNFEEKLSDCDLLVNSTSLGMTGQEKLVINLQNLKKSAIVYDIVYKPPMTDLLIAAKQQNNQIITGIGMLIYQALVGFEAWFKQKPEIDEDLIKILNIE